MRWEPLLVAFCFMLSSAGKDAKDEDIEKQIKSLLDILQTGRKSGYKERREQDDEANKHIKAIETETENDLDSIEKKLFASFKVYKDGEPVPARDIHPEASHHVKAMAKDRHKLTPLQKIELGLESEKKDGPDSTGSRKRAFTTKRLWEMAIIPYEIDDTLSSPEAKEVIQKAVDAYNRVSCVQWVPHTKEIEEIVGHTSFVKFFDSRDWCWSWVGRTVDSGPQELSLEAPACIDVGSALHEMTHAAGTYHEQSRSDRDYHVAVRYEILGLTPGEVNYGKFFTQNNNPYDYQSVEQYPAEAGLEILQPDLTFLTFINDELSFYDVADLTDAYKCTDHCKDEDNLKCLNGGYLNFKCECNCPYGLEGKLCETVKSKDCGGIIDLKPGEEKTITSPNFPSNYPVGKECVWLIRAPKEFHVRLDVDVFHLPYKPTNDRCYHWLEVRKNLPGQTGSRMCGDTSGKVWVTSPWGEKNIMLLIFNSAYGEMHPAEKGFSMRARTVGDGCNPDPCVYGKCQDCDDSTYKCECLPGFESKNCDTVDAIRPLECTFEEGTKCFLKDVVDDDFDWRINSGHTVSEFTGPDTAIEGKNYLYAEASAPRKLGDKAILKSDITFPEEDRCLQFYYNMFGFDTGTLTVRSSSKQLWSVSGNQGFGWHEASIDIPKTKDLQLEIEVTRGNDWEGDIALDAIKLFPGVCEAPVKYDCLMTTYGVDYKGTKNVTVGGRTCQRWDDPEDHDYHEYDGYENYCRNELGDEKAPWCFTTDKQKEWEYCYIPHCHIEECVRSINGYDYLGSKDTTKQGFKCKPWSFDNVAACRGYDDTSTSPWCFTTDPDTRWDTCDIPRCTTPPKECLQTPNGVDYFGSINVTVNGNTCQRWDQQEPNAHAYWFLADQENYCRNPDHDSRSPWCYIVGGGGEYCDIPICENLGCDSNPCLHGATCSNTDLNGQFKCQCRPGFVGERCQTRDKGTQTGFVQDNKPCSRHPCKNEAQCENLANGGYKCNCENGYVGQHCETALECLVSNFGKDYRGTASVTRKGLRCKRWDSYPDGKTQDENYCRNTYNTNDMRVGPWCFTSTSEFDYCDIPLCDVNSRIEEMDCRRSKNGYEYQGHISKTISGITCQRWDSDEPHDAYHATDQPENFCRNTLSYGEPWCYTTDPDKRWELCDIPYCNTTAKECADFANGWDYFGTTSITEDGHRCQSWGKQTPHSHSYGYLEDQENFCRNPRGKSERPWCYTVDSEIRWQYCNIPRCE